MGRSRREEPRYYWDEKAARFRDSDGKFISEKKITQILEARIDAGIAKAQNLLTAVLDGGAGTLSDWTVAMASELRYAHTQSMALGMGGWSKVTARMWGKVGATLKGEYKYLHKFAGEIEGGKLSRREIERRMKMYSEKMWSSYWQGNTEAKMNAGYTEERRIVDYNAESCQDCLDYAKMGWQPIGSLPEPGQASACGSNCRCTKEYR